MTYLADLIQDASTAKERPEVQRLAAFALAFGHRTSRRSYASVVTSSLAGPCGDDLTDEQYSRPGYQDVTESFL